MSQFQRNTSILAVTAGTTAAASTAIPFSNAAGGMVYLAATPAITSLTWHASHDGVTYVPVMDGSGAAVTSTIAASQCCLIPAACFGANFLKAVANTAGTIYLSLKS